MAIKPDNPQPGVQAQAERPQVLGPLVAGVVVIKVFAAIKGEQAVAAPVLDWIAEDTPSDTASAAGQGLSIPSAIEPSANPDAGARHASPLASQADGASVGDDASDEEADALKTASNHSQSRTGDDGFERAAGPATSDAPGAAGEPGSVASANGAGNAASDISAGSGDERAETDENSGRDGFTEDAPEGGAATPTVSTSSLGTDNDAPPGDTRSENAPGADTLLGGAGDDVIRGHGGDDTLDGRGGDDELYGGSEDDRLMGADGDDHLEGGGGDDLLRGGGGDDSLDGGAAADRLFGLIGDDLLIGALGPDELSGGAGADRFVFNEIAESDVQDPDRLLDFRAYERDKIDVSGIDANSQTAQDEAFAFIENEAFSGAAGELRFTESQGSTHLYGDVNGDGEADFALELLGVSSLSVDDIIL